MKENLILDVIGLGINGEGIAKKEGKIFVIPYLNIAVTRSKIPFIYAIAKP